MTLMFKYSRYEVKNTDEYCYLPHCQQNRGVYDQVLTSGLTYQRVPATLYGICRDMEPICAAVQTVFEGSG